MTLARSPRLIRAVIVSACLAAAGLAGAQSSPAAMKACSVPQYPDSKLGGYFTSVQTTNLSCSKARRLVLAYYKCRRRKGVKGSCSGKTVNGLKCTEKRPPESQSALELNAKVTCRKGSKKVVHTYQQNLR
jgi:hypothetical protein